MIERVTSVEDIYAAAAACIDHSIRPQRLWTHPFRDQRYLGVSTIWLASSVHESEHFETALYGPHGLFFSARAKDAPRIFDAPQFVVIVQETKTRDDAQDAHADWVRRSGDCWRREELNDVSTSAWAERLDELLPGWRVFRRGL